MWPDSLSAPSSCAVLRAAVAGFGLGAAIVAATTTAMAHVEPRDAGVISGLTNTGSERPSQPR